MIWFSTRLDSVEVPNVISRDRIAATTVTHKTKLRWGCGEGKRDQKPRAGAEKLSVCHGPSRHQHPGWKSPVSARKDGQPGLQLRVLHWHGKRES